MSLDITAASALYLLMWWLHHNKHYQWSPQHRLAADTRTRSSSWYQIAHRTLSTGPGNEGPLVGSQSWKRPLLEAATTAFTFETQLTHIMLNGRALRVKTQLVDMKLGSWCEGHKGQAALRHYANQPTRPLWSFHLFPAQLQNVLNCIFLFLFKILFVFKSDSSHNFIIPKSVQNWKLNLSGDKNKFIIQIGN